MSSPLLDENELVYQIHSHLVYELKWLIHAASSFQSASGHDYVAFLDSATLHARNLLEFAYKKDTNRFTLAALEGTPTDAKAWRRWCNNRVTHMLEREHDKAPWPGGKGTWNQADKLMLDRVPRSGGVRGVILGVLSPRVGAGRGQCRAAR